MLPVLWAVSGCLPEKQVVFVRGDDAGDDSAAPSDDTAPGDSRAPTDADADGWSVEAGDCADDDPAAHPEATDACDGADQDCDGAVDEDATDPYEPNDSTPTSLGTLNATSTTVGASISVAGDVDRFGFYTEDPWYWDIEIRVAVDSVGASQDLVLVLQGPAGTELARSDTGAAGHGETIYWRSAWDDGTGDYQVLVWSESGWDCADSYGLTIQVD